MNKSLQYMLWMILSTVFIWSESFIVLATDMSEENISKEQMVYNVSLDNNEVLKNLEKELLFETKIEKINNHYVLKVGPFKSGDALALVYLNMKNLFPKAFIVEEHKSVSKANSKIKIVEKTVEVEKEDQTLWIALFGLALIGIFALFLSSDQIRNLNKQHRKMQDRQEEIEKKQSLLLEKMGEKIQTVALKNVQGEKQLLAESFNNINIEEIKDRIHTLKRYDEELLRTTYEMIDFLKIKSGNIVIKEEPFQLSFMLHKLTNAIADTLREKHHTLIYNVHNDVSRYLMGDSERIYQILHNIIVDVLESSQESDVMLSIEIKKETDVVFSIMDKNKFLTDDEIETLFLPISWEELQESKKEFSFSVIKELIANMKGEFVVTSDKKKGTLYTLSLPYVKDLDNKSRKAELQKLLLNKKAMVVDTEIEKTKILINILDAFGMTVIFKTSESLAQFKPHIEGYDFIIIKAEDISQKVFDFFKNIDPSYSAKIIVIHNIFDLDKKSEMATHIANEELFAPLIPGDVEEILTNLCIKKETKKKETFKDELQNFNIVDIAKVTRDDFKIFKDKTVLIAENNAVSQQVMSSILSASNLTVYKVENGVEVLVFLRENPKVDLILMDIDMPLMDGYEATRLIRKSEQLKDIPVVAVTGLGFYHEQEDMVLSGMNACILKPYKVGQLYVALEKYLLDDIEHEAIIDNHKKDLVLDVDKGISYVRSEIFYKEIVSQVLLALKNSDVMVEEMIKEGDIYKLKAFCVDSVGLARTLGATHFVSLLTEMLIEMHHKTFYANANKEDGYVLKEPETAIKVYDSIHTYMESYILRYKEEWKKLEYEMKTYLNS